MEKLTRLELESLDPENKTRLRNIEGNEDSLRLKLSSLGVKELTSNQVQSIASKNLVTPYVTVPGSNSNVRWYEIRYTHTRSGKSYEIQELYAQAVGYRTNLYSSSDGLYLINGGQEQVNLGQALINVYANKLIASVAALNPITNILPYELFINIPNGTTVIAMNSDFVTYRALSTACFSYVKDAGKSDDYLTLSYTSNMFDISATHVTAGISNPGTSSAKPVTSANATFTNSVYATDYASSSKAVDQFLNLSRTTSYAKATVWRTASGKYTATADIFTPSLPSQITVN